jgi:hypothetical protein
MIKLNGWEELQKYGEELRSTMEFITTMGPATIRDAHVTGLRLQDEKLLCGTNFDNVEFVEIEINDVEFYSVELMVNCMVSRIVAKDFSFERLGAAYLTLRDCSIENFSNTFRFSNNAFTSIENTQLLHVDLNGYGDSFINNITDSTISGFLNHVVFRENAQHTQCQGVDLSEARLRGCEFYGIDMGRVKPNPAWRNLIVSDWFQYVADLREASKHMRFSDSELDRDAAKYITKDLVDDEAAYAKPLDAQRGAKYLGLIVAPRVKEDTRKRIAHIYADVGVNLNA